MKFRSIASVVMAGAIAAGGVVVSAPAQAASTYKVTGVVFNDVDAKGSYNRGDKLLVGKTVYLKNSKGKIVRTAKVASNGSYSFTGLVAGNYSVVFNVDGGAIGTTVLGGSVKTNKSKTQRVIPVTVRKNVAVNIGVLYPKTAVVAAPKPTNPAPTTTPVVSSNYSKPTSARVVKVTCYVAPLPGAPGQTWLQALTEWQVTGGKYSATEWLPTDGVARSVSNDGSASVKTWMSSNTIVMPNGSDTMISDRLAYIVYPYGKSNDDAVVNNTAGIGVDYLGGVTMNANCPAVTDPIGSKVVTSF